MTVETTPLIRTRNQGLLDLTPRFTNRSLRQQLYEAHKSDSSLREVPSSRVFIQAYQDIFGNKLVGEDGNHLTSEETNQLVELVSNYWVRFNTGFMPSKGRSKGFLGLDVVTYKVVQASEVDEFDDIEQTLILKILSREPLEECVTETGKLVELSSLNRQGLPTTVSKVQQFKRNENLIFYPPVEGRIARLLAGSVGVGFSCDGDPAGSNAGFGVPTYATGTKNS